MTKTSIIIGASSEIGREIIRNIDLPGSQIIAHAHSNIATLDALRLEVNSQLDAFSADLSRPDECADFIKKAKSISHCPDNLVFSQAPRLTLTRFNKVTREQVLAHLEVQIMSSLAICNAFLPAMAKRGRGRVVFILSSVTLGMPPSAMTDYTIAKYAQLGLMRSLASDFGSKGVRVNAVSPSMVDTPFLTEIPGNMIIQNAAAHPMKRNATPNEIAPMVAFLLSDGAEYINGVNLPITGGECV